MNTSQRDYLRRYQLYVTEAPCVNKFALFICLRHEVPANNIQNSHQRRRRNSAKTSSKISEVNGVGKYTVWQCSRFTVPFGAGAEKQANSDHYLCRVGPSVVRVEKKLTLTVQIFAKFKIRYFQSNADQIKVLLERVKQSKLFTLTP